MSVSIFPHHERVYTITTPIYEGPLDLLLQLIERAELDITKLALAQVTDQYIRYLNDLQTRSAEEVSAFLVIAARLLQIKSEALLPRPKSRIHEDEEDDGEVLARQLQVYKRYKEVAGVLGEREHAHLQTYLRLAPPPKITGKVNLSGLSLGDMVNAAIVAFYKDEITPTQSLNSVVPPPKVTIRQKIGLIAGLLRRQAGITFRDLIRNGRSRSDVVVTFLAMLELVKRHLVNAYQQKVFGEIQLEPTELWNGTEDLESEFGE